MKPALKVCGITSVAQLDALAEMGVDLAGLIFYDRSPRYISRFSPDAEQIRQTRIDKVGVFVNAGYEEIAASIKKFGLGAVQLHGQEKPELCYRLGALAKVIKAFPVKDADSLLNGIEAYSSSCQFFLFDTVTAKYGGSGASFDWGILENTTIGKPFFLSGGIAPTDVKKVKLFGHPFLYGIDINSRFETAPGIKDLVLVESFKNSIR